MKHLLLAFFCVMAYSRSHAIVIPPKDSVYTTNGDCKIRISLKGGMADVTMDGKTTKGRIFPNKHDKGIFDFIADGKTVFFFMYEDDNLLIVNQDYRFGCSASKVIELNPEHCFVKTTHTLPYNRLHSPDSVQWNTLSCEIAGVQEFLCDQERLRYLSLPDFGDVSVLLVPMDCGDFGYYWYLLTVKDNRIIGSEYVEGIWYEPGDEVYKEYTRFSIDASYRITVVTEAGENGKKAPKSKTIFQLQQDGQLKKG